MLPVLITLFVVSRKGYWARRRNTMHIHKCNLLWAKRGIEKKAPCQCLREMLNQWVKLIMKYDLYVDSEWREKGIQSKEIQSLLQTWRANWIGCFWAGYACSLSFCNLNKQPHSWVWQRNHVRQTNFSAHNVYSTFLPPSERQLANGHQTWFIFIVN